MLTTNKFGFHDKHVEYLTARKIPLQYAHDAGVRSLGKLSPLVTKRMREIYPGLQVPPVSALMVEYTVPALDKINRARLRPDDDSYWTGDDGQEQRVMLHRWLTQAKVCVVPYFPPQVYTQEIIGDTSVPLFFCEAPIKALSLSANGFDAIGLGGVEAGLHDAEEWKKNKHLALNKELERIKWPGRLVYIVYDAGIQNNPLVALGAAKLALVLKNAGAIVKLVLLPLVHGTETTIDDAVTYGLKDQGPDDFLGRHGEQGPEKLRELIEAAVLADPVARVTAIVATGEKSSHREQAAQFLNDLTFVAGLHVGGGVVVDQVATILDKLGIKKRSIREKIDRLQARLRDRLDDTRKADGQEVELPYVLDSNRIAMKVPQVDGTEKLRYLADFTASITEEILLDDGTEALRNYRVIGKLPGGHALPPVDVPGDEFAAMDWVSRWGSKAIIRAGRDTREHARVAIQHLSKPSERTVYAHLGWREIDGKMVYLHPGGAIGASGVAVEVTLGREIGKFWLPSEAMDLPAAVAHSLSILDCGPLQLTLPALAAAYTAPLASILEVDFALYFVGETGSLKSTLASKAQAHFGHYDYNSLPISWFSTANSIELVLHRFKDALVVLDNYVPPETGRPNQELQEKALRVIQSIGDRSSRGRLDRNSVERARRDPRCLALMTGEDLPPVNESTIGRLLVLDVPKGALRLDRLRAVQEKADLLPHAMAGYIQWLAADYTATAQRLRHFKSDKAAWFRAELAGFGCHERVPNSLATLTAGFDLFLSYAKDLGVINDDQVKHLHALSTHTFLEIAKRQRMNVEGSRPTDRYISALRAMLIQGRIVLAPLDEPLPKHTNGTARAVGWESDDEVLLVAELAWDAVESFFGKERWPYKQSQMQKKLADLGVIKRDEDTKDGTDRLTVRRTCGGSTKRVLAMPKEHLQEALRDRAAEAARMKAELEEANARVDAVVEELQRSWN